MAFSFIAALAAAVSMAGAAGAASITLGDAMQMAREHNPTLAAARADARAVGADKGMADAMAGPNISAGLSYTSLTKPTMFFGVPVFERDTQVNVLGLHAPVYDASLRAKRRAAGLAFTATEHGIRAVEEQVLLDVARQYWTVAAARQYVDAARDTRDFLAANLDRVNRSREAGLATRGDVLRAEAELALASDRLLSAENGVRIALSALKLAIGLEQDEDIDVDGAELRPDARVAELGPADSPAILAAEAGVRAAEQALSAARSGKTPTVSLDADIQGITKGADFPRTDGSASAMIRVNIPIFDSGMTRSASAKAAAERDRAASDLKAVSDRTAFRRKAAELALENAHERWKATEKQVASALESRRLVEIGASEGIYTQTDLMSAQSVASAAQASRIQSLVDLKVAEAEKLAATSRLDILAGTLTREQK